MRTFVSDISKKEFPVTEKVSARTMQEKIDHFIQDQQLEFMEIQKKQIELLNYLIEKSESV
jgi:hypothetical protein